MKFFVDNNLSIHLAHGMREFGEDIDHLQDHFLQSAHDEEWLPVVGKNGWILITRDDNIRWRVAELRALRAHDVGAYFLGGKNLNRCQLVQQLVRNWPQMKAKAQSQRRPFALRVPPSGGRFKPIAL